MLGDNIVGKLCFVQKWNPSIHGVKDDDENFINYLKTKKFVLDTNNLLEDCNLYIDEVNALINDSDNDQFTNETCKIMIAKKYYIYRDRIFILENNGITLFQKLWKKYHNEYIIPRKQLKNIFKREIYGKFII